MPEIEWRCELGGDPISLDVMSVIRSMQWKPEGTQDDLGALAGLKKLLGRYPHVTSKPVTYQALLGGLLLHHGLDIEGIEAFSRLFDMKDPGQRAVGLLLDAHDPVLVEVFFKYLQLKPMMAHWPALNAWMEGEGANAVEGLVQMCVRRGKRRDFAIEKLAVYVQAGHVDMVEESLTRVPGKVAELVRAQVIDPREPLAPEPVEVLPPAEYPEWLRVVATLPDEQIPEWLRGDFPLVGRVNGKDGVVPRKVALRVVAAASRSMPRPWEDGGVSGLWMQLVEALRSGAMDESHAVHVSRAIGTFGAPSDYRWLGDRIRMGQALHADVAMQDPYAACEGLLRAHDPRAWAELVNVMVTAKKLEKTLDSRFDSYLLTMHMSREQAYDRLVPTFGLDEDGTRRFDYGARVFEFTFDETFTPAFREASTQKPYRTLPPARKGEDKAVVAAHKVTYKSVKVGLGRTVEWARARFEDALVTMRSWSLEDLRTYMLPHPLMRHFIRGLVWGVYGDDFALTSSFVFEQDGALTSSSFDGLELPDDARVRLVHPHDLGDAELRAWSVALSDSEIAQPFLQLERPMMDADEVAAEVASFERVGNKWGRVKALDDGHPGWVRGVTWKGRKRVWYVKRELPELGAEARLLVKRTDWILPRGGDEPRAGLHLFEPEAVSAPENSLPLERVPTRVLVELLREIREA